LEALAAGIEAAPRSGVGFLWLDEEYSEEPGPDFLSGAAQEKYFSLSLNPMQKGNE
jgi:hypothetical protein